MATKIVELFNVAAKAASVTGDAKSLAIGGTKPVTGETEAANARLTVGLALTSIAGTGTLDFAVEGKFGADWMELVPNTPFAAVTTGTSEQVRTFDGPVPVEIRGIVTRAGSVTFDAVMTAIGVE